MLIWYIYMLQYDHHVVLASSSATSHGNRFFVCVVGIIRIQSLSKIGVYNTTRGLVQEICVGRGEGSLSLD